MATTYYTIYFTDNGSPKTGLSPVADAYYNMSTGVAIASAAPFTVSELGSGLYRVAVNWDHANMSGVTKVGIRIDSEDVTMSDSEKYIAIEADVDDATSLSTIGTDVSDLDTDLTAVLNILNGNWEITNNQLILKTAAGVTLYTFNLFDSLGTPTSTNPASRVRA